MKNLMKRLSRVSDSSNYSLLRSDSNSPKKSTESFRKTGKRGMAPVPEGHLPVFVGEKMERFVVNAQLLNNPIFVELLDKSAQIYGYEQKGVLRIPCPVFIFERVLEAVRLGDDCFDELEDFLNSISD